MSTQNTMTEVLEDTRAFRLQGQTETLGDEKTQALLQEADAIAWEAERARETPVQPGGDQRQPWPTYPEWPTSTPGPQATLPLPGMKPVPTRSDQMVYACYDQERGRPCTPVGVSLSICPHPLADKVKAGLHVYDAQGARVGKILMRFPHYLLVERGLIFRRSYYVPLALVQGAEGKRVRLVVSLATLDERGYGRVPGELYYVPRLSGPTRFPDVSEASLLGKYPPTPAETGHYHYGPYSPGINTDASGSYAPHEIDPYGRPVDRPVKLHSTGELVPSRTL